MKAVESSLLNFLDNAPQFIIPIYQRTYSWQERECTQLWKDILECGGDDEIAAHFIGSIVYIAKGIYTISRKTPFLVIDGQQRLTTISLILEALARKVGDQEPIDGFSAEKIREYYLMNRLEKDERRYKLLLTQTDKNTLTALLDNKDLPIESSLRIEENFQYFMNQIEALDGDFTALCQGLQKLIIVDISLNRNDDNPQLIFESMNSTGKELTQADLIRNYVLMGLEAQLQTDLYQDHWRPMEVDFGQGAYDKHFDNFMRHFLTIKTDEIPRISEVYESFKAYSQRPDVKRLGVAALLADIHTYSGYYCRFVLGKEPDPDLRDAFQDLREIKIDVAYPLLLELYHDYATGVLGKDDLLQAIRLVESYVFRRAVCSIPTNSLNKTFATFGRALKKDRYLESVKAHFISLPSYRRFPDDEEFKRDLKIRDLYNFKRRSYWLRRLENFGRKERVPVAEYTIEHIMPQDENLSTQWQQDLGLEWENVHETWLHTLGNLTLTGYNSEYSNRSFTEKRDMEGGFRHSPLHLNEGLGQVETWDENAIHARAERLANFALNVWAEPSLPDDVLAAYAEKPAPKTSYSIDDHQYLSADSPMRTLFQKFRNDVLNLDKVITEEFLKFYVAYKAETNFVDVVAQASSLRLSLNMPFPDIDDPRGICRDVTNLGRWGNGDVEIHLDKEEDLPYVIGLVRQAFERQMGNGNNE